jgi:Methyltransferase domain
MTRTSYQGALEILRFNRRFYLASAAVLAAMPVTPAPWRWIALPAIFWSCSSLLVSHFVYDLYPLYRLAWLPRNLSVRPRRWLHLHAGLDEIGDVLPAVFPAAAGSIADFFDPAEMTEPSIRAARVRAATAAPHAEWHHLPFADAAFDAVFLIFAAHELRRAEARARLFREAGRVLAPSGELAVVEHLRNWQNFLAFGPGFLHFFSARAWRRTAADAGLTLRRSESLTPFVRLFVFGLRDRPPGGVVGQVSGLPVRRTA